MTCVFTGGPADGTALSLHTAPHFLRVVIDETGNVDALDQPDDVPAPDETIHVYVLEAGSWSQIFIRPGGRYESGRYHHLALAGDEHELRTKAFSEREEWINWVTEYGDRTAVDHGLDPWKLKPEAGSTW